MITVRWGGGASVRQVVRQMGLTEFLSFEQISLQWKF